MAKVKVDRKSQIIGTNEIKVDSIVSETMDYSEYKNVFAKWSQEASNFEAAIGDLKLQLQAIGPVKDKDPAVIKLKETLVEAEKLKARDDMKIQLQDLEIRLARKKEEITALQPNFIKIMKAEKDVKLSN